MFCKFYAYMNRYYRLPEAEISENTSELITRLCLSACAVRVKGLTHSAEASKRAHACVRLKPYATIATLVISQECLLAGRSYSKCDQALERLPANELEDDIKAVGQASAPQRCCSQSASLKRGHFSCCPAYPSGCSLSEDPAGLDSICAALLPVQGLPPLEASGKSPCQVLVTPGVIRT